MHYTSGVRNNKIVCLLACILQWSCLQLVGTASSSADPRRPNSRLRQRNIGVCRKWRLFQTVIACSGRDSQRSADASRSGIQRGWRTSPGAAVSDTSQRRQLLLGERTARLGGGWRKWNDVVDGAPPRPAGWRSCLKSFRSLTQRQPRRRCSEPRQHHASWFNTALVPCTAVCQ